MLADIYSRLGPPPLWARESGFPTLVYIILEQQVSLASARAAYTKLIAAVNGKLTPKNFLNFTPAELKTIGFSRQKAAYSCALANSIINGEVDLAGLDLLDDDAVFSTLLRLKGVGHWTASIYLLMVLLRPDSWPGGDLALAVAVQELKNLPSRPTPTELEEISLAWRPWRAVAARLLWAHYLDRRGKL